MDRFLEIIRNEKYWEIVKKGLWQPDRWRSYIFESQFRSRGPLYENAFHLHPRKCDCKCCMDIKGVSEEERKIYFLLSFSFTVLPALLLFLIIVSIAVLLK
jgi:hypothetical protein